jgi:hypothetical protein
MRRLSMTCAAVLLCTAVSALAAGQTVTNDDLFALQDSLYEASREVAAARNLDPALAASLQRDLDAARDDAVYLRVKLRKEGAVSRSEYDALRVRIDNVRARAKGQSAPAPDRTVTPGPAPESMPAVTESSASQPVRRPEGCGPYDVCTGQELDVRLQTTLNSDTAQVEDRFEATTLVPFYNESHELIPAGSLLTGVVSGVNRAGRVDRKGSLSLAFEKLTVRGVTYDIRAMVTKAIESRGIKAETAKIAAGAGMGAMIGGVLGGVGGALAGLAIGGGGVLAATEGADVQVPAGTVLRLRFDAPVTIR